MTKLNDPKLARGNVEQRCWVRIIVVAYNSGDDLQKCIDLLETQTFNDFEVIVIDNASSDDAVKTLKLPDKRFNIVTSDKNLGFAAGSNLGAKGAECPWLITLNPDAWPTDDWLENLFQAARSHPGYSILGTTILSADNEGSLESFGDTLTIFGMARPCGNGLPTSSIPPYNVEVFSCCAAGAAYKREIFEIVGGFDESYFCYLEDVDLAYRIRLTGHRCLQVPSARLVHLGSSSSDKIPGFRTYYSHRNNLRLILKNTPLLLLLFILPIYICAQLWLNWRNRNRPDIKARKKGFSDAIRSVPKTLKLRRKTFRIINSNSYMIAKRLGWSKQSLRGTSLVFWKTQ